MATTRGDHDLRTDSRRVGAGTLQRHRDIVVGRGVELPHAVAVDRRRRVEVVDDEIECAVIVEVHVRRAVRETGGADPPGSSHIDERQIAVVAKQVVGVRDMRHFRDQAGSGRLCASRDAVQRRDVVEVVRAVIDARRDEQVLEAVIVEIGEQRRPTPVGGRDSGEQPDVAEAELAFRNATIQLQRVARVLVVIASLELQVEKLVPLGG